jgi:hypothetical protein
MTRRRTTRVLRTVGRLPAGLEHVLDCECDGCPARRPSTRPPFPAAGVALLGELGDRALAARLGISPHAVAAERDRLGIPAAKPGPRPRAGVRADVCRTIKFTQAEAEVQDAAAGDRKYASWAHDRLVEAAAQQVAARPGIATGESVGTSRSDSTASELGCAGNSLPPCEL